MRWIDDVQRERFHKAPSVIPYKALGHGQMIHVRVSQSCPDTRVR